MTYTHRLVHMIAAAEAWGHTQYGQQMCALVQTGQHKDGDGTLSMVVQLYPVRSVPYVAAQPQPVGCLVSLAPDGTLACRGEDDSAGRPSTAPRAGCEEHRREGVRGLFRALASFGS